MRTILLVDDEEANLDLLESLLEADGFLRLVRVNDARQVLEAAAARPPDLILLDLHMPHRHGLDLLRDLRAMTAPDEYLPVLVLTADVTPEARERALRAGARDFLTKPFDTTEVVLRVENLLETRLLHLEQQAARQAAERGERRAALLAEWSRLLAMSLDATTALAQLPALVVPSWCEATLILDGDDSATVLSEELIPDAESWRSAMIAAVRAADVHGQSGVRELQLPDMPGVHAVSVPVTLGGTDGATRLATIVSARRALRFDADARVVVGEIARRAGLAAERARLFAAAELATRERERLLAVVAHDLRNPLAVVAMYAEMLASMQPEPSAAGPNDDYGRSALATICRTTTGMQALVEDLLDASTLRDGVLRLNQDDHEAPVLFDDLIRMLQPLASASGITLDVHGTCDIPGCVVRADARRLGQVLSNLVGNAIRFTPRGGTITIRWRAEPSGIDVAVTDEGPGISADELPHLFTAFWQGKDNDRRGAGLGLWIARAIVEGHGGTIGVESPPGAGATFRFSLPSDGRARRWED